MYLYIAIFPNNKKYIGISNNFKKRKITHKSRAKNNWSGPFYNAIRKYGFKNISWTVADGYQIWKKLCNLEMELIKIHNTCCLDSNSNGYNATRGGDGYVGFKHTDEWKAMMSRKMSGENSPSFGRKLSKKEKEHLSKINSGKLHPRYGKKKSKEEIAAMTRSLKKYYEENDSHFKGKQHTNKAKEKISKANNGENNGMYGKKSWNNGKKNPELSKKMLGVGNPMYGKKGEKHPGAKLTYKKAEEIRKKYKTGQYTHKLLSEEFGVSGAQISKIIKNKVWVIDE